MLAVIAVFVPASARFLFALLTPAVVTLILSAATHPDERPNGTRRSESNDLRPSRRNSRPADQAGRRSFALANLAAPRQGSGAANSPVAAF